MQVQRESSSLPQVSPPSGAAPASSGARDSARAGVRGKGFAAQEAALAPRESRPRNGPVKRDGNAAPVQREETPAGAAPAPAPAAVDPVALAIAAAQSGTKTPVQPRDGANIPAAGALIPFDARPLAAAGERIIFNCTYSDPNPGNYLMGLATSGANFDTPGTGRTSMAFNGLATGNQDLYLPSPWNNEIVTAALVVLDRATMSTVASKVWVFSKKPYFATEMTQQETEGERPLPSSYGYKIGPDRSNDGRDDYVGHTILERFLPQTSNLRPEDLNEAYRNANGLTSEAAIVSHFWPGGSGDNGTFTVFAGDMIYDQHGGGMPNLATFTPALATPKEVTVDLPQIYEAQPGVTLARYSVRRILKTDGSKKLRKWKVT